MKNVSMEQLQKWSAAGHRTALGETLVQLGEIRPDLVTVTADLTPTARLTAFRDTYPERFFDVGIAEQNLIDFSAGMAKEGVLVYAVAMSAIVPMRCAEQMRVALGYMNLNVKVVGIEAGLRFGPLGNTHYAMDDIAVVRVIPNFTIITPSDPTQVHKALVAAADYAGPVYIRLTGGPGFPVLYPENLDFQIGKAIEYRQGTDVAFISSGSLLSETIEAAEILEKKGISARIIDMHTIKPLDTEMLDRVFDENALVVTVEEHSSIGGLGSAVAEYKAGAVNAPRQVMASLGDSFKELGDHEFHLRQNGLKAADLAKLAEENLG